jgi:hypothetical protein
MTRATLVSTVHPRSSKCELSNGWPFRDSNAVWWLQNAARLFRSKAIVVRRRPRAKRRCDTAALAGSGTGVRKVHASFFCPYFERSRNFI